MRRGGRRRGWRVPWRQRIWQTATKRWRTRCGWQPRPDHLHAQWPQGTRFSRRIASSRGQRVRPCVGPCICSSLGAIRTVMSWYKERDKRRSNWPVPSHLVVKAQRQLDASLSDAKRSSHTLRCIRDEECCNTQALRGWDSTQFDAASTPRHVCGIARSSGPLNTCSLQLFWRTVSIANFLLMVQL